MVSAYTTGQHFLFNLRRAISTKPRPAESGRHNKLTVCLSCEQRDARQAEIDAKHGYKHGWIIVDGSAFDRYSAFPDHAFVNVWD
jgi:uncharacterized protein CbrC (UPF0167 family)